MYRGEKKIFIFKVWQHGVNRIAVSIFDLSKVSNKIIQMD